MIKPKPNKTNIMRGVLSSIVAFTILASAAASQAATPQGTSPIIWTTRGKPSGNMDVLYVQNAKGVILEKGKLVLRGVNSNTVCFTDRPARLAGHLPTSSFTPLWSQGKDSFLKDPPNATLSIFNGNKVSDLVVEISNPVLSGSNLTYDVKVLEGAASAGAENAPCSSTSSVARAHRFLTPVPRGAVFAAATGDRQRGPQ